MVDLRIEKLAKICVYYSVEVKPGESVLIQGSSEAFPLINEIYKECLLVGAYPMVYPRLDLQYTFFKYANEKQLSYVSPIEKFIAENVDVNINIYCDPNPQKINKHRSCAYKASCSGEKRVVGNFLQTCCREKVEVDSSTIPNKRPSSGGFHVACRV